MASPIAARAPQKRSHARAGFIALCTVPALVLYALFVVYPTVQVFYMSLFRSTSLGLDKQFVGLSNFIALFKDSKFLVSLGNQFFFIIVVTIITMACSMFFAALLTQSNLREKPFYRTVFFFPNVLSMVIISMLFVQMYDPSHGILNAILGLFGIKGHTWLGEDATVLWCIAFAMVWQAIGYYMVMYMSGMDSISKELYEVADLEGMGKFKQFFKITLPLMWEVVRVTIVFFIISTINMSFTFVNIMAPAKVFVPTTYMYNQAFQQNNYGFAMCASTVMFIISFLLALLSNKLTARDTVEH